VRIEALVLANLDVRQAIGSSRAACARVLVDPAPADLQQCRDFVDGQELDELRVGVDALLLFAGMRQSCQVSRSCGADLSR